MEIILGKTAGFCYGVKRAVDGAKEQLKKATNEIYCLGEIVHNEEVINDLKKEGLRFVEDVKESKGDTIIRAHGVPKNVYKEAKIKKINLYDYTCPKVLKIHEIAEKYAKDGFYILLCGSKTHPENIGTLSFCGKNCSVIETVEEATKEIENLRKSKFKKVLLISQTTYKLEKFSKIEEIIKEKLSQGFIVEVINTICKATELRQIETKEIAKKVEYMIIIGGKKSSNTQKLYEIAKENCKHSICIQTKDEINIEEMSNYEKIGIMAGASTPMKSIENVIKFFKEGNVKNRHFDMKVKNVDFCDEKL